MMRAMYGLGILLFLFLPSVDGGDASARARAALALADAKTPKKLTYAEGCAQAIAASKDLWVYVGMPSKANDTAIVCEAASLEGYPAKCIVVSRPSEGAMYWVKTLDEHGKEVRPVAAFFRSVQFGQSSLDCTSGG